MKRLNPININSSKEVEKKFNERWRGQLHYIDWVRFKKLVKYFAGGRYLDVGCFNSPMPYELAIDKKLNAEVYALDSCKNVISILQARFPEVHYLAQDWLHLPFEIWELDYIVVGELIEHLEDPKKFIEYVQSYLKPGGYLALSTPYKETLEEPISNEHLWSFDDNDIIELLKPYGEIEITHYKDTTNNIIAFCKKYEKTRSVGQKR